jgi:hypothetical protein
LLASYSHETSVEADVIGIGLLAVIASGEMAIEVRGLCGRNYSQSSQSAHFLKVLVL